MFLVLFAFYFALVVVAIRFMLLTSRYIPWVMITIGLGAAWVWHIAGDGTPVSQFAVFTAAAFMVAGAAILGPPYAVGRSFYGRAPESDSQFRKLADGSLDVLTVLEWDGRLRYVSSSVESVLGYHPDQLVGKNSFRFIHREDRRHVIRIFTKQASIPGAAPPVVFRFRHRDGTWRTLETVANNLLDDDQVRGIVLSSRDVTERIQVEQQLRRRAQQQQAVAEIGQNALSTDDVQKLCDIATCLVREALGSTYTVVFDPRGEGDRLEVMSSDGIPDRKRAGMFGRQRDYLPTTAQFLPDVAAHPMFEDVPAIDDLGIVSGSVVQIPTEAGRPSYLASFCVQHREYTQQDLNFLQSVANVLAVSAGRRWVEDALQTAERSVHTLLTSMPLILWAWDKNGVFTLSQGHGLEQLGLKPGQVVGMSVFDVYKDFPDILANAREALAGKSFSTTVDLDESTWDVWYRPVRNEAGEVTGVLGVALDVADRERAEEGIRRIFHMSQDLLCVGSLDGKLIGVNPAFTRTLGWSEEELLSQPLLSFVHPDDRDRSAEELRRVGQGHSTIRFENRCLVQSGGYRWLSWMATPVRESGMVYASARDVTDARAAQEALQASEQKFARAFHANPTLMSITRLEDGRYVEVNDSYLEALGYTREEIIGRTTRDLSVWIDHKMRDAVVDELTRSGSVRNREVEYVAKNGDRRVGLLSAEVIALSGEQHILALFYDITSRQKAEQALLRSESELRHLVDHAIYGIYRSTEDGKLLSVNPALVDMLGYESAEELMAIDMGADLYADGGSRKRVIAEHRERGRIQDLELRWRRKDGSLLTVRVSGRTITDSETGEVQFEMFVEDVTEREALEAQLRQAQKMEAIGQLTGGIAHDFNNILTAVLGNAEILAADLPSEFANLQAEVADIRSAAQRGAAMIRKLMTFSRREALEMHAVDPDQLCQDTTAMLRRILPENIEIEVKPGDIDRAVYADRGAIEQILVNLATNGRDAMDKGGTLTVTTSVTEYDEREAAQHGVDPHREFVVISVSDSGSGMDAQTQERIFDPFYTTKPTGRGTGLGMAMVYALVSRHKGFIDVESAVGEGTTVSVAFPAVEKKAPHPAEDSLADDELPRGSEHVLLVEDEAVLRRMGERILRRFGYHVVTAQDGQEAWEMLSRGDAKVDIVVTDVIMPRLNGGELYDRVQNSMTRTPFLFTTGYAPSEVEEETLRTNGLPLLHKPWTANELVRGVRGALDAAH